MATNYNEKKRIVESMIKEERMSRFACELGSPVCSQSKYEAKHINCMYSVCFFFSRSRIPNSFFLSMNERQSSASSSNLFFVGAGNGYTFCPIHSSRYHFFGNDGMILEYSFRGVREVCVCMYMYIYF